MATGSRIKTFFVVVAIMGMACRGVPDNNRLAASVSPYLREHADNPVDWYEWGNEALNRAQTEDKPLLISIGYASCHWCHRMEEESFMDTAVARLMNENFICIKVDREERPDIDNLYMHACQLLNNGQAGWPLNAFALPDGKPFFAGTYFSKENWMGLLKRVNEMYRTKRAKVNLQASSLTFGIADNDSLFMLPAPHKELKQSLYRDFFESAVATVDTVHAGIKGNQKFPVPVLWDFFLQYHYYSKEPAALQTAAQALDKMAASGLYDWVGGGFFRYATDSVWMVPHFEKMLNDNAQLVSLYSNAYKLTQKPRYRQVAEETLGWIEKELSAGQGGYFSSLGADTKEGEGAYYLLKAGEPEKILGSLPALQPMVKWHSLNQEGVNGQLSYLYQSPAEVSLVKNVPVKQLESALSLARQKMQVARDQKEKPPVDNKIIVSWNALLLQAYADAYTAFGSAKYLQHALELGRFVEKNMMNPDGTLKRIYAQGRATGQAFLDDYAYLGKGFIRLYEISFNVHWLEMADKLTEAAISNFFDTATGNFFYTPSASDGLAIRKVEWLNNVMPASNAVMGDVLLYLGVMFQKNDYLEKSSGLLRNVSSGMPEYSTASPAWGILAGRHLNTYREVAIAGTDAMQLNLGLQAQYLPDCIFMGGQKEDLPLMKGKLPSAGSLIYVCTDRMCKRPVQTVSEALEELAVPALR